MRRRLSVLVAVLAATLTACGTAATPAISPADGPGGGDGGTGESRDVSGFTGVELTTIGNLVIDRTGTESLTIEAEPDVLPLLTSEVSGGVLRLGVTPGSEIATREPIVYRLTVAALDSLSVSGAGDATATNLETDRLTVDVDGAGDVTLAGTADAQVVRLGGAGDYDAEDLRSATVEITVGGAGDAVVNASDRLDATVGGAGSVEYVGNPQVTQDVSGVGSVEPR
ncbi:head GIN domain-containing protein [Pseudonocardia abyssalis]|uniref:DUF2807 domain-containing protein n=1 Tax=Pseudonocardia abyssalis TaxID=2792008 RepID=A0ABS6UMV0_9PSEU|nr:head GIN domain-containing protein [Pseudonocardia abyssalis]MBW0115629.1 DUF2807 domain-containing protein [Pseudonocardia abyssalis]MBW0133557.1 DUF2807 domain-containing protein [Pseudonocardia abyssalis]